ncbi:PAS domain-containing hybrid sensor histidine kinase/response regulator [Bacillus sp. V3-13]|uniref:PAS domain-containing hybrid sensor histidine kinase/response regulator n=1 Tax=Bacillus sp. V3-13 TaxID=2053728 RepID=UPI0015E11395|nr:PAS domain S-box protein [Bacillus sp. V3-13]
MNDQKKTLSLVFFSLLFCVSYFFYRIIVLNDSGLRSTFTLDLVMLTITIFVILFIYQSYIKKSLHFERFFVSLFEHNPSLTFLIDGNGKIISVNSKVINILNYAHKDLISNKFWNLFENPDELHYIQDQLDLAKSGKSASFIGKLKNKEANNCMSMNFTLIPIREHGLFFIVGHDISELQTYRNRIVKTQIELRNTIRQQQGMMFKFIKQGDRYIHTLCDGELLYRFGLTPQNVIGKSLGNFLTGNIVDDKTNFYHKAWAGETTTYEGKINGISYLASLRPILRDGKVIEVIGSCVDISDRKNMEEELRKKTNLYRSVLTTMSEGIFLIDKSRTITNLNENVEEILGIKSGIFSETTMNESGIEFVREDGTLWDYKDLPGMDTTDNGTIVKDAVMGVKENGHIKKWISVNSKPLALNEESASLVSFSDISLQKKQELELKEMNTFNEILMENTKSGILVIDENRNILLINKALREIFGINCDEKVEGVFVGLFHSAFTETENFSKEIEEIAAKRAASTLTVRSNNGYIFKLHYSPLNLKNRGQAHLWTFEDITEMSKLQESTLKAQEEAVKANMAKSDFLSKMSHELRTPLNGILGFAQLLELEKTLNDRQQTFVKNIITSGGHLLNLINEILDVSRIETGKLQITSKMIHASKLIDECIGMMSPLAEKNNIAIIVDIANIADLYIYADPVRLRQVMLNLIDNAIKYNKENGRVNISCEKMNNDITVYIKDTGIGFSNEHVDDIFEPFYRIKETNTEGTGIGLSLTRQLIQLMGGSIGAKSVKGKGSTFWFSLPIHHEFELTEYEDIDSNISPFEIGKKFKSTILYIEDNLSNIDLLKEIIEAQTNYSVIIANSGKEGLDIIKNKKIDLVLLDINLPDINGYQVFDELKQHEHTDKIPVIAISANAINKDIQYTLDKGFADYITKPININEFLLTIKKYV